MLVGRRATAGSLFSPGLRNLIDNHRNDLVALRLGAVHFDREIEPRTTEQLLRRLRRVLRLQVLVNVPGELDPADDPRPGPEGSC